ncbi:DUF2892 domain-containing protein [Halosimplex aquaticum]|uniref:DUF2892 domain-containing protein n=1 Tax=Halosimplex aquaticum TaxID=3026162 RepID=A0ABD5Y8I3_9EURY|nr:DUF2892 domain-containing protein [Halosimplex aquaticum]
MELSEKLGDRSRLVRVVLTAVLAVVALQSFRKRKRTRGVVAGLGAAALGYTVSSESGGVVESLGGEALESIGAESTAEGGELRCAYCGEPIVPGERRKPNEDGETVHEACLEATA